MKLEIVVGDAEGAESMCSLIACLSDYVNNVQIIKYMESEKAYRAMKMLPLFRKPFGTLRHKGFPDLIKDLNNSPLKNAIDGSQGVFIMRTNECKLPDATDRVLTYCATRTWTTSSKGIDYSDPTPCIIEEVFDLTMNIHAAVKRIIDFVKANKISRLCLISNPVLTPEVSNVLKGQLWVSFFRILFDEIGKAEMPSEEDPVPPPLAAIDDIEDEVASHSVTRSMLAARKLEFESPRKRGARDFTLVRQDGFERVHRVTSGYGFVSPPAPVTHKRLRGI